MENSQVYHRCIEWYKKQNEITGYVFLWTKTGISCTVSLSFVVPPLIQFISTALKRCLLVIYCSSAQSRHYDESGTHHGVRRQHKGRHEGGSTPTTTAAGSVYHAASLRHYGRRPAASGDGWVRPARTERLRLYFALQRCDISSDVARPVYAPADWSLCLRRSDWRHR